MKKHWKRALVLTMLTLLAASCGNSSNKILLGPDGKPVDKHGEPINPYEPGTYEHFKAERGYPKTSKIWKNDQLLPVTDASNSRLILSRKQQRGFLLNGDEVVLDYPISTGKEGHATPDGEYKILEKTVDKHSNAYGNVYDAEGNRIYGKEKPSDVPEGGRFDGAPMPYWMRLTNDGVGHHVGNVPRYPASHGCIRGPRSIMPTVFRKVKVGTEVTVE
ncbi:lipoprotein-anchoring transpeptidase ErfK/SrfK [Haloferula luteola]|uniref:Lipoprotein-anchoring transpeptidase ErfK/SrfK n=1 Tax=Haloferula luteola TaxID=595692 RepID=A0A840VCZ3_9BACT|nr:L,D-transpeptidase family protein [Haloferula luteola]MBB5352498.1 lipoprotein-anchoring transpeptidase ErfK/SrfK [Haloferula luteola]